MLLQRKAQPVGGIKRGKPAQVLDGACNHRRKAALMAGIAAHRGGTHRMRDGNGPRQVPGFG